MVCRTICFRNDKILSSLVKPDSIITKEFVCVAGLIGFYLMLPWVFLWSPAYLLISSLTFFVMSPFYTDRETSLSTLALILAIPLRLWVVCILDLPSGKLKLLLAQSRGVENKRSTSTMRTCFPVSTDVLQPFT